MLCSNVHAGKQQCANDIKENDSHDAGSKRERASTTQYKGRYQKATSW